MSIQVKDAAGTTQTIATLDDLLGVIATAALQGTGNTALAAILAKIIVAPATEAKQDTGNTALAGLDARLATLHADLATTIAALLTSQNGYVDGIEALLGTTNTGNAAMLAKLTADPATQTTLAAVLASLVAATPAGEFHVGEVGGNSAIVGGTFNRPANVTAYVVGQLVANSVTAGAVQPISCTVARKNAGTGVVVGVRLSKSSQSLVNAAFRVHLFKTSPTTTAGDGVAFASAVNGIVAVALGYVDITMDVAFSDGAKGFAALSAKVFEAAAASQNIYALIEARGAYTPASAEVFTLALEVLRD